MKARSVVRAAPHPDYDSVYLCDWGNTPLTNVLLDLTDPTGRVHVAWWALAHPDSAKGFNGRDASVVEAAGAGVDMEDEETAILKNLVLRLAGRMEG